MKHYDKLLHFLVGASVQFALRFVSPAVGLAAVLFAAWGKEEYDRRHPLTHTKDGWDAVATFAGAVAIEVAALIIKLTTGISPPSIL